MEVEKAILLCKSLMAKHGLEGWQIRIKNWRGTAGAANSDEKTICLSRPYLELNTVENVTDTILHEIAHALVGTDRGHDKFWKEACRKVGAVPSRCKTNCNRPVGKYRARCPKCQIVVYKHRRPSPVAYYCIKCGPKDGQLVWVTIPLTQK